MVEVKLLDDDGVEVTEPRKPGEVFVRSPSIFDTYHKAHEKYEAETRGEFHTVGDVAFVDEEGFYFICDRKKDMIISGGVNIYPAEIEAALALMPGVRDSAVFGIPDEEFGEALAAAVQAEPGFELAAESVKRYLSERIASYKVPRVVTFHDELPREESGKIFKRRLRAPYWEKASRRI
jgi:acyl-CoA synthetase (AMP-forming)/AMP-acid ligase II